MRILPVIALMTGHSGLAHAADQGGDIAVEEVVVVSQPYIIPMLAGLAPEQSFDAAQVASYAASTIGEVIDAVAGDNGDDAPSFLINGQLVLNREDIDDYPAEAIAKLEVYPKGTAQQMGGAAGQRVYNIVLHKSVTSATVTATAQWATEGEWGSQAGETLLTRIQGPNRVNVGVRLRHNDRLLEADRGIVQPPSILPTHPTGVVVPYPPDAPEIDPALSALAGRTVAVTLLPIGLAAPTLSDFVAGAHDPALLDVGRFRTLRPDTIGAEATLNGSLQIASWLTASLASRWEQSRDEGWRGLPTAQYILPTSNSASPFSQDVLIIRSDTDNPLSSYSRYRAGNVSIDFTATLKEWTATIGGRYAAQTRRYDIERIEPTAAFTVLTLPDYPEPFVTISEHVLPTETSRSRSRLHTESVHANMYGPLFPLPAGSLIVRANLNAGRNTIVSEEDQIVEDIFKRSEVEAGGGLTIPLTSSKNEFLGGLGETSLSFDASTVHLSSLPSLARRAWGLSWQPRSWIQLTWDHSQRESAPDLELLLAPVNVYDNIRVYDPVRDETVDVTWIAGGNPDLRPEKRGSTRVAVSVTPLPTINLRLYSDYTRTFVDDLLSALPPIGRDVVEAFPERFVRAPSGTLIEVDSRAVNFTRKQEDTLRFVLSFSLPLYDTSRFSSGSAEALASAKPRLDFNWSHVLYLNSSVVIRPEIPSVDLLAGGAIGYGGGLPRHLVSYSLALTDRGSGIRISGNWRSTSVIATGTGSESGQLRFGSLATANIELFSELARLWPQQDWAFNARLSLRVVNVTNQRQQVTDSFDAIPINYQPAYLDPVGRTVVLELRKVF